jgi:cytoskeleton protein RodZ
MFIENVPNNDLQDFKKLREARGLSLEDLFKRTRVRVVYLQAIEKKEFNLLPVPVYSKNFIRIYARALGIDSKPIINEYEDYLNSRKEQTLQQEEVATEKFSFARIAGKKTYLVIVFILIAVIVTYWLISKQHESSSDIVSPAGINTIAVQENKEQSSDTNISLKQQAETDSVAALKENGKRSPIGEKKTFVSSEVNINNFPKRILSPVVNMPNSSDKEAGLLVVRATEETWLRVKADQRPSFQVFLKAGEKFEHKAVNFDVDIGNAGGIKVKFRGRDIENLGKAGEVVHLRLP